MFDFCFTIPYAALLMLGGAAGFVASGSLPSLVAGAGSGMALLAIGNVSLQNYKQRRVVDKRLTAASLVITSIVGAAMLRRYRASGKLLPAGLIVAISAAMIAFYAWSLAYGPKSTLRSTKKPA